MQDFISENKDENAVEVIEKPQFFARPPSGTIELGADNIRISLGPEADDDDGDDDGYDDDVIDRRMLKRSSALLVDKQTRKPRRKKKENEGD